MENQMRICFVSLAQFKKIWDKSMPSDRLMTDLTTLSLMSKKHNALFIVGRQEDFMAKVEDILPENWLVIKKAVTAAVESLPQMDTPERKEAFKAMPEVDTSGAYMFDPATPKPTEGKCLDCGKVIPVGHKICDDCIPF